MNASGRRPPLLFRRGRGQARRFSRAIGSGSRDGRVQGQACCIQEESVVQLQLKVCVGMLYICLLLWPFSEGERCGDDRAI